MAEVIRYKTPKFRLSFPELFNAKSMEEGGEKKYGCSAVWTPDDFSEVEKKLWKKLLKALDDESKSRFNKPWAKLPANVRRGLRDGEERSDMEGYGDGTMFASLTTKMRPGVVSNERGEDGKFLPISPEEGNDDEIYPGCYCRATVTVYSYDGKGKGVAIGLMNIQKVADGERLDSRTDAAEDFDDDFLDDDENLLDDDDDALE